MISDPEGTVLALFAAFCRIGGCLMVLPGFGSYRVPVQIRLLVGVALSMALLPLLWDTLYPRVRGGGVDYLVLVGSELLIGVTLGLIAHFIVLSLQFAGTAVSMSIGLNTSPSQGVFGPDAEGQLTLVITTTGLLILFLSDFHHTIIEALIRSYRFLPLGAPFEPRMALMSLTDTLSGSFALMLRLASPFLVYGLIFNMAIGMVNKLAPQIPVYYISIPFILFGGLLLFFFGTLDFFSLFLQGFGPLFEGN